MSYGASSLGNLVLGTTNGYQLYNVATSLVCKWGTEALVNKETRFSWNTSNLVSNELDILWGTLEEVSTNFRAEWNTDIYVANSLTVIYETKGNVGSSSNAYIVCRVERKSDFCIPPVKHQCIVL